ncbi:hypothetical protein V5799_030873 [Amblyomma americanum]|uniref:Uncharacterized protein n=1 Tax=Amblyomma americanum TaxID=6943 RepID=A0AAQ4EMD0_AMBAM
MPTYGALEPFHGEGGAWTEYLERVKLFFDANSVPEEKKKSVFLTCCGSSTYSLLRSLLTPKTPDQVSIDEIFSVLSGHYIPKPSVVVCRFRFNSRSRQPEESVSDYTTSLKKLSANFSVMYSTAYNDPAIQAQIYGQNGYDPASQTEASYGQTHFDQTSYGNAPSEQATTAFQSTTSAGIHVVTTKVHHLPVLCMRSRAGTIFHSIFEKKHSTLIDIYIKVLNDLQSGALYILRTVVTIVAVPGADDSAYRRLGVEKLFLVYPSITGRAKYLNCISDIIENSRSN